VFVRDYGQFDGSVAVNITPFAQVFVEGTRQARPTGPVTPA
jgi:iron complex outermembrane receptor protein